MSAADRIVRESFVRHVEWRAELPSTNDLALALAADPAWPLPAVVLAERQTAGRGRGSNRWWAADGALTFSLAFEPHQWRIEPERWPRISLAAAVAICDALAPLLSGTSLGVKWPNDVQADGRKIAGLLVEIPNAPAVPQRRVILGIGLNVNNSLACAPPELREIGTSLVDLAGHPNDPVAVLMSLLDHLSQALDRLGRDDPELPTRWQELCVLRGRQLQVDQPSSSVAGICQGIANDGALILDTPGGRERVYGGTVRLT